jgi:MFS family permease
MKNYTGKNEGLFSNRNYRLYFTSRIISQLGDQMYVFAVSWYAMDLTRSGFHMAALLAVNSLIVMAVSPFAGLLSDRISRKKVMVVTDLIQGAVLLSLLALQDGRLSIGVLYAATVILGLCGAVFSPAASAVIPGIVGMERVPGAVAAGQAASNLCIIAGMVIGGLLYRTIGISGILALNAASNILAAAMEARVRISPILSTPANATPAGGAIKRFVEELIDGLRQVRTDRTLFALLLINTAFSFVVLPIPMVYLPYFFNILLGASPLQAAFAQAGSWIGIILGSAVAGRMLRRHRTESLVAGGLLAISVTTFLFVLILWARKWLDLTWLSGICALSNTLAGASGAFFVVPLYAFFHARSREEFRGRFWGLEGSLRTAATCAGFFVAGILVQRLPLATIFADMAALMFVLFLWVISRERRLKADPSRYVPPR